VYYNAEHPEVVSVFLNQGRKLHTTHSWEFMDMEMGDGVVPSDSVLRKARYGEDTIIAHLDTGNIPPLPASANVNFHLFPSRVITHSCHAHILLLL